MFTIIGGDGKEYGPATAEQIRSWITAGRANLDTKARAVGSEEWRRLGDYAEFGAAGVAAPPIASSVPPATTFTPAPTYPANPAPVTVPDAQLAERGTRLIARIIDWILSTLSILPGVLMMGGEFMRLVMAGMRGEQIDFESIDAPALAAGAGVLVLGWLVLLIVQVILLSIRSQSIGKLIMRLKVVRLDGTPGGFLHAWLLREPIMTIIGVFLGIFPWIGMAFRPAFHLTDWCFIFRDDRRCLHDLIAGTKVVKL